MKLKIKSDDDFCLNKTPEVRNTIIFLEVIFYEDNKYYFQLKFLDECLKKHK